MIRAHTYPFDTVDNPPTMADPSPSTYEINEERLNLFSTGESLFPISEDFDPSTVVVSESSLQKEDKLDLVNNPPHYRKHPSGVECIQITRHMCFNLGNAIKYIWRCDEKTPDPIFDLRKAIFYLEDEIKLRQERQQESQQLQLF
jgi:hypothetical protein